MRTLTAVPPPTVWQRFAQVPHRAYFCAGVCSLLLLAAWWSLALPLAFTYAGVSAPPAMLVHGVMMPLGIFPPFMLGFVFTAGPRWLGTAAPKGHLPLALGQVGGVLLALLGFYFGGRWPLPGIGVLLLVWWRATWLWFECIVSAPPGDKQHAYSILVAMLTGNVALLATAAWAVSGDATLWLVARNLILWGWILPIFLVVAHRMIPFFTQSVVPQRKPWRPQAMLQSWLFGCAALVVLQSLAWAAAAAAVALLLAIATGYAALQWAGCRLRGACGGNRLLAMLHLSFAWLPVAFLLLAFEQAGFGGGSAAVHAFGLGFCATMLVGFVTRVTLGHSGRPLQPSAWVWRLYLGLHAVALLRVGVALGGGAPALLHALAAIWLMLIAAWAARMLPAYWRPRADGQPG